MNEKIMQAALQLTPTQEMSCLPTDLHDRWVAANAAVIQEVVDAAIVEHVSKLASSEAHILDVHKSLEDLRKVLWEKETKLAGAIAALKQIQGVGVFGSYYERCMQMLELARTALKGED